MNALAKVPVFLRLLIVAALVAAVVWQANEVRSGRRDDRLREDAIAIAKAQVLDITTLDSATVGAKLEAMAARTSGDFKDQVTGIAASFIKIVSQRKIKAVGRIDGIGISSSSGQDASVLVASTTVVSQAGSDTASTRTYRMRIHLVRAGASWKINGMEFVQ